MSSEFRIKRKRWHTDFNDEKLICTDTKYLGMERGFTLIERIFADRDFLGLEIRKDNSGLPDYE
jgi:hypothetical protein